MRWREILRVALKKSTVQGRVSEGAPGLPKRQVKFSYADTPDCLQRILHLTRHLAFNLCKEKAKENSISFGFLVTKKGDKFFYLGKRGALR